MTPQLAQSIYYYYYGEALIRHGSWDKPVIQHECAMEASKAVIDHVENDELMEIPEVKAAWDKYVAAKEVYRTHPVDIAALWHAFTYQYEKAKDEHNSQG